MNINIFLAALTYASILVLLTEAFTLTYSLTNVPNFTIGALVSIGAYVGITNTRILEYPMYLGLPLAFLVGSIVSLGCILLIVEPLIRQKRTPVQITLVLLGLQIVLTRVVAMYSYLLRSGVPWDSVLFIKEYDFVIGPFHGITIISFIFAIASTLLLRVLIKRTGIGVHFKAISEDDELAQVQGINTKQYRMWIWAFAGGLAGLAGSMMITFFHFGPLSGSGLMTTIIASSMIGGISNPERAIIGGMILGMLEILLTTFGQLFIGAWFAEYRPLIPIIALIFLMKFVPQGIFERKANR